MTTTREDVERAAVCIDADARLVEAAMLGDDDEDRYNKLRRLRDRHIDTAAMLRALLARAEKAEARADLTWFWEIVDRDGLTGLPSDERGALALLVKRAAERDAARAEAARLRDSLRAILADPWISRNSGGIARSALATEARDE